MPQAQPKKSADRAALCLAAKEERREMVAQDLTGAQNLALTVTATVLGALA